MQTYLLATTTLALAALMLGLNALITPTWRLGPLFLLTISQLLGLVAISAGSTLPLGLLQSLSVFSTLCFTWLLSPPLATMTLGWRRSVVPLGFMVAIIFTLLPLTPLAVEVAPIYSVLIALGGIILLWRERNLSYWLHGVALMTLIMANVLQFIDMPSTSGLANLVAFAFLIRVVHQETVAALPLPAPVETLVFPEIPPENLRLLEISQTLNNLPDTEDLIDQIVRHITQVTRVDQSAMFVLDDTAIELGLRVMLYPPAPLWSRGRQQPLKLKLDDYPSLQETITTQQQLILPQANKNGLHELYSLWQEHSTGPTLLQPLTLHGQAIGALLLGNPLTNRPIHISEALLCQTLAPQIATLIHHQQLHRQTKAKAKTTKNTPGLDYLPIFDLLAEGVVVSNEMGRVTVVNKMAEQVLGRSRAELLGQPIGTVYGQIASGETIENLAATFSRQNKPIRTHLETNGRIIEGQLTPWRDQEGQWLGIITTFHDVTLSLKMKHDQDELMSAVLRELRSPLTVIKGYSDLITSGVVEGYQPEQLELQEAIQSNVDRMVNILNNLVHFRAHLTGQATLELLDVTEVVENAVQNIKPLTDLRQIALYLDIQAALPPIMTNARHLRRILDNLLENACQFTPKEGEIIVRVWSHSERFGTIIRPELFIAVEDNGVGMPDEEHRRIFKPFYQIKGQTEARGLGMGLAVVKTLLDLLHGRVEVASTVGAGSKFTIAFPLPDN